MINDLNKLAREIIEKNEYLALATTDENNNAWVSPICYAFDKDYNFYFASIPSSKHCVNFSRNNKVSFAIYDSTQNWGEGVGLQIEGTVEKVKLLKLPKVTAIYFGRKYPYRKITNIFAESFRKLIKNKIYSFYKIIPTKFWMNDPNAGRDERIEMKLA